MSFGGDVDAQKKGHHHAEKRATRRLDSAKVGERVRFLTHPTVKSTRSGAWVPAPSLDAEVVYYATGSPFVKFVLEDGRKTDAKWVGSSALIEAEPPAARG